MQHIGQLWTEKYHQFFFTEKRGLKVPAKKGPFGPHQRHSLINYPIMQSEGPRKILSNYISPQRYLY